MRGRPPLFFGSCTAIIEKFDVVNDPDEVIINFKESTEFTNAIKLAIAAVIPVLVFSHLRRIDVSITIGLGAFFVFQSDVPSILKHKTNGLIVCSLIISGVNLLINLSFPYLWLFFPTLCVLLFSVSMLAVYDQRATTIAFSSLLSISLSFSHIYTTYSEIFVHAGLLLSGGGHPVQNYKERVSIGLILGYRLL